MRVGWLAVLVVVLFSSACVVAVHDPAYIPPPRPAPVPEPVTVDEPDEGLFYDDLAPYGRWVSMEPYGWVWSPRPVTPGWRPYTLGRWILTDEGWYWDSEEPWAWATYHYGRWAHHPAYGWVWIPGRDWAPSWVAWRHGDGWIGWAPLPPHAVWRAGIGLDLGGDLDLVIEARWWGFVPEPYVLEPRAYLRFAPPDRNHSLCKATRNATRYGYEKNRVVVHGVDRAALERSHGRPLTPARIVDDHDKNAPRGRAVGHEVHAYRPKIQKAPPSRVPRERDDEDDIARPLPAPAPERRATQRPPQGPDKATMTPEPRPVPRQAPTAPPEHRAKQARPLEGGPPAPPAAPPEHRAQQAPPARKVSASEVELAPPVTAPPPEQRAKQGSPRPASPPPPERAAVRPPNAPPAPSTAQEQAAEANAPTATGKPKVAPKGKNKDTDKDKEKGKDEGEADPPAPPPPSSQGN